MDRAWSLLVASLLVFNISALAQFPYYISATGDTVRVLQIEDRRFMSDGLRNIIARPKEGQKLKISYKDCRGYSDGISFFISVNETSEWRGSLGFYQVVVLGEISLFQREVVRTTFVPGAGPTTTVTPTGPGSHTVTHRPGTQIAQYSDFTEYYFATEKNKRITELIKGFGAFKDVVRSLMADWADIKKIKMKYEDLPSLFMQYNAYKQGK